jgi:hypothetical protein
MWSNTEWYKSVPKQLFFKLNHQAASLYVAQMHTINTINLRTQKMVTKLKIYIRKTVLIYVLHIIFKENSECVILAIGDELH